MTDGVRKARESMAPLSKPVCPHHITKPWVVGQVQVCLTLYLSKDAFPPSNMKYDGHGTPPKQTCVLKA